MKKVIKQHKKSDIIATGLILIAMLASAPKIMAQDGEKVQPSLKLDYFHIDSVHSLTATLRAKVDGRFLPLEGMDISFRFLQGGTEKSLGSAVTNEKGKVTIEIPEDIYNTGGDKGVYSFDASFSGKDNYDKALGTTAMRPLRMELSFSQKEGQKMATLKAFEQGPDNQWIPVEKLDVVFYVPRTFSLLKVGQAAIENGSASMEFPVTVPGNPLGYITLLAKVEDNEFYGNVEASGTINWGKPLPAEKTIKRGLGDTNAPLWMVYTLIVLLSLVWFHYMYVIFTVFRIRHLGKS